MGEDKKQFYGTIDPIKSNKKNEDDAIHHHVMIRTSRGTFTHKEEDLYDFPLPEERGKFFILDDTEPIKDYKKEDK